MQQAQWPRRGITAASSPSPRRITCHAAAEVSKQPEHIHVQVNELYSGKITKVKPQVALVTLDNQAPAELYFDHVSSAPVEDLTKLFQVDEEIKAAVISSRRGRPAKLSIREIEIVPGQMLTDKQAVFQAAPQAIKLYQERKEQTMEARRQALALIKIGDVVPATVKAKRKEGWLVGVGGVNCMLHHGEYVKPLVIGQTMQVRVRKVLPLSAMAYVSARFEPGSEGGTPDAQPSTLPDQGQEQTLATPQAEGATTA
ncbi:uncharacterized protein HaLaN_05782 [Haematococcus lacustris]|uniref:S1 motif domain-containing protein n=1 Tax=Haematococcus lacustris TaxID=44745 RepID=A0A699YU21_HAELA|nr:uncharacterized protein HaLaN_05782 [Haematococcus lacustris]